MGIIETYAKKIGQSADQLIEDGFFLPDDIRYLFAGDEEFTVTPVKGLKLKFDDDSRILRAINIVLIDLMEENGEYKSEMPEPLMLTMNKEMVRRILGTPTRESGPVKVPVVGLVGGNDRYINTLPEQFPGKEITFFYRADFQVQTVVFKNVDTNKSV